MVDIDPKKVGTVYTNHRLSPPLSIPIVHFSKLNQMEPPRSDAGGVPTSVLGPSHLRRHGLSQNCRYPVVVCVSMRRGRENEIAPSVEGSGRASQSGSAPESKRGQPESSVGKKKEGKAQATGNCHQSSSSASTEGPACTLEDNVASLQLEEGVALWYFV